MWHKNRDKFSLYKRGSKRRKSNSHSRREFLRFFYAHFQNKLFASLEKHACPALLAAEGKLQSCCGESTWKSQSKPTEGTDAVLPTERLPLLSPATRFHDSGLQIPFHQQYHVCRGYSFAEDSPAIRDSGWRNTYSDSLVLRWHHGHIFGNGSLNAESDKKYRSCVFIWCMCWLNIGWGIPIKLPLEAALLFYLRATLPVIRNAHL